MAQKKLMNYMFKSLNDLSPTSGPAEFLLYCASRDNIDPVGEWITSSDQALNAVGGLFGGLKYFDPSSGFAAAMQRNNYIGQRSIWERAAPYDKLYLDGRPDYPYITYTTSYSTIGAYYSYGTINFYQNNGTFLGSVRLDGVPTSPANSGIYYSGQLYDDGSFSGQRVMLRSHTLPGGGSSDLIYEWICLEEKGEWQLIPSDVAYYLAQFMSDPEGEDIDPGGRGDRNSDSDPIDWPGMPGLNALATGLVSMYRMTSQQLVNFARVLWSDNLFDLATWKKMFTDPMEAIINLSIEPLQLTESGTTNDIIVGNMSTNCSGAVVANPYQIVDFGTLNIAEYWGTFVDYSPYTNISIYLPYVGIRQLNVDDLMPGRVQLKAYCDGLTGSLVYHLYSVQRNAAGHEHRSILYSWAGECQYQIPFSATNMTRVITAIGSAVMAVGGAVATVASGGAAAPAAAGAAAGAGGGAAAGAAAGATGVKTALELSGGIAAGGASLMGAKEQVQRGGAMSGNLGLFGVQYPYLILQRPEQSIPQNYNDLVGKPSNVYDSIGALEGLVKVLSVHIEDIGNQATASEKAEIERLLRSGVRVL